jgi:hypothetical protein
MQVRFVKKVLGNKSPANLAAELVDGTGLADVKLRRRLLDADEAAIATATDPMIALVRNIDPDLRTMRRTYEDDVRARLNKNSALIANAMFKLYGRPTRPATVTPCSVRPASCQIIRCNWSGKSFEADQGQQVGGALVVFGARHAGRAKRVADIGGGAAPEHDRTLQ